MAVAETVIVDVHVNGNATVDVIDGVQGSTTVRVQKSATPLCNVQPGQLS
jgi:hypothetical protein